MPARIVPVAQDGLGTFPYRWTTSLVLAGIRGGIEEANAHGGIIVRRGSKHTEIRKREGKGWDGQQKRAGERAASNPQPRPSCGPDSSLNIHA